MGIKADAESSYASKPVVTIMMSIDYVHYHVIFKISSKTENLLIRKIIQCNEYSSIKKKKKKNVG